MSWWDGSPIDRVRMIRDSLRADRQHLASALLGPRQKTNLARIIAWQEKELKRLLKEKREAEVRRDLKVKRK